MVIKKNQNQDKQRIISSKSNNFDNDNFDNILRPKFLKDYIGQNKIKEELSISKEASLKRKEPLDHILLYGPPGIGKTTLAYILANEMGVNIKITSGPALEKQSNLVSLITNLKANDVLFIDEIHRLKSNLEEILYTAMEDFVIDLVIGKGPSARSMRLKLPKFTLIGATTKMSMLSSPLRDRFGHIIKLDFYSSTDMEKIIQRSATILEVKIDKNSLTEISKRARRTPRIGNRLLKRIRDFASVKNNYNIDINICRETLNILGIDSLGLDETDRAILNTIINKFHGGPVGLNTLAAATSEDKDTIEDVYEPYLIRLGFLERTPKGRKATMLAYQHLGINSPKQTLF